MLIEPAGACDELSRAERAVLRLARPSSAPLDLLSDAEWQELCLLARRHGLAGLLCLSGAPRASELTADYLKNYAVGRLALEQLAEIARSFGECGVPFLVLKGCAALLFLYDAPGSRQLGDIDILIAESSIPAAEAAMRRLGYAPLISKSRHDGLIDFRDAHLMPFERADSISVEIHGTLLYGRADFAPAARELWRDAVPVPLRASVVRCPSPVHFLVHALMHAARHLDANEEYPFKLKDVADILRVVARFPIDPGAFRDTIRRWDVAENVAPLVATLNRDWGLALPVVKEGSAIPLRALLEGTLGRTHEPPLASIASGYRRRLARAARLPGLKERVAYFLSLLVPPPAVMRARYRLAGDSWLAPHYFRRWLNILARIGS